MIFGFTIIYAYVLIVYEYNNIRVIYKFVFEFICFIHINLRNDHYQE